VRRVEGPRVLKIPVPTPHQTSGEDGSSAARGARASIKTKTKEKKTKEIPVVFFDRRSF